MVLNVNRNHEAYWGRGEGSTEMGGEGDYILIATLSPLTRMTSALRWATVRAILIFHNIVRDKVTRQCPQTTTFEEKGEPKQIRTEVFLLTSLTPYR